MGVIKINVSATEVAFAIIGVFGSTSFYAGIDKKRTAIDGFDKRVFDKGNLGLENWRDNKEELSELVNKIGARWKKINLRQFVECLFSNKMNTPLKKFFEAKRKFNENNYCNLVEEPIKDIVNATGNIKHAQNTRVSKILHILAPNLIPMIDPEQGNFILGKGNYNKTNRNHLTEVFEKFHYSFAKDRKKISKISKQLKKHKIEITELRIFELLIWLQTQYNKKFNKEKSPVCLICHEGVI